MKIHLFLLLEDVAWEGNYSHLFPTHSRPHLRCLVSNGNAGEIKTPMSLSHRGHSIVVTWGKISVQNNKANLELK